jgi:hypothetical protein
MPTRRARAAFSERMRSRVWPDRACTSTAGICASTYAVATAGLKSIQSRYRASTELQTDNTFNTRPNTYNTKHRSKS